MTMTASLAAALCEPIDDEAPCGPDLDLAYDPEYSLFVASSEGLLPAGSYFQFDRTQNDLAKESRTVEALLKRTRDLRLLVLLAKFRILNRELAGFCDALAAMAALMRERWEQVHPAAEDDDFGLRIVVVESLDDMTSVIMPLQHAPLVMSRRLGAVNYRMVQIANGEVTAREGEPTPDTHSVDAAFMDAEMTGLVASRDQIATASAALSDMQMCVLEHDAGSLSLDRLKDVLGKMKGVLDGFVAKRDPTAAQASQPASAGGEAGESVASKSEGPSAATALGSLAEIRRALTRAELYFQINEPSSPALLLVAQARQLVGKGLAEAVMFLMPSHASDAVINVGGRMAFELPIERLATLVDPGEEGDGDGSDAEPPAIPGSRREALDILQQVANHLRVREPSSAIPLLCERARSLAERDFMSLLREMLPDRAFRNLDEN